jgi:tetratricopeptide (TPR) repeat protein
MGRLGKSSLAARIANRRRDLRLAVVFGRYGALDVLAALSEALKENPKTRDLLREGTNLVGQQPDRLEDVLTDLLCGPCSQTGADGSPVLLVIDDLEQILEADPRGGRHRVAPSHAPVLRAVLGAFDAALHVGNSRVVVTSRFPFVLGGLERRLFELPLPPLSEAAQRKLELRQKEAAVDAGLTGKALTDREKLLKRVPAISQGNPGLQDLIGRKLILSTAVTLARAERTVEEMEAWLARGDLPSDAEVRAFLENLAVDALLDLAGAAGQALLCGLTLFDLPVPQTVAEKLEAHLGGSVRHLRDLGLLDVFADRVDHRQPALAVNALAAGRLEPLHDGERSVVAHAVAHDLFIAWGGVGEIETRPSVCDLQLAQLGLMAEDDEIVSACAAFAVAVLNQGPAAVAATFGQAAIRLLDTKQVTVPWRLLGETAEASATSGDGATADALLVRGVAALEQQRKLGASVDPVAAVFLVHEQARRLVTRGRLDEAKVLFAEAARYAEEAGQELSATIARGAIANILYRRGDLDEALRIRREEELPVYERLGDVRSRAITMGQIADILESRGDLDEALRIRREEELPVYERLGDVRSRAVTLGKIADILYRRGDLDEALRIRREEQLPVFERLGDVRERAVTMGKIADILYSRGDLDEALRIRREEQLPVFERLGDVRERAVTMSKIADILQSRGDLDEALRIFRQELLPAFERLDDVRSRAVVLGRIADILVQKGDRGAARALQDERLETNRGLADADGIGAALWDMAQLDLAERKIDDAIPRIMDAYGIVARLGRAEGIAVIGRLFGQILVANDKSAEARVVLQRSADAFRKLGREADAQEVEELICELNLK